MRQFLEREIELFDYDYATQPFEGMVGVPWSQQRCRDELEVLRKAIVAPYFAEIHVMDFKNGMRRPEPVVQQGVILTDNSNGYWLAYLKQEETFAVVDWHQERFQTIGIFGDATGCFLSM